MYGLNQPSTGTNKEINVAMDVEREREGEQKQKQYRYKSQGKCKDQNATFNATYNEASKDNNTFEDTKTMRRKERDRETEIESW